MTNSIIFLPEIYFTDTHDSQGRRERRGASFISLYYFHPLTNIQAFVFNFAFEMTIKYV